MSFFEVSIRGKKNAKMVEKEKELCGKGIADKQIEESLEFDMG